jgi:ADP-heptose:LPS heptosyltransferase
MKAAFIALGKCGDVFNILAILHKRFQETGEKQTLIISKDYCDLLEGCSYITPDIFDGTFGQLKEAVRYAKQKYDAVTILQVYGDGFDVQKRTPSFVFDQWERAGFGVSQHFAEWPLVFDNRSPEREAKLIRRIANKNPFILVADNGESSPFVQINDLCSLLADNFPDHDIIRLSQIRAEKFYDFIGLYDRAVCVVATETAHLHLVRAAKVPVIALATDKPTRWHGTPWHPRYRLHIRYSEFDNRKAEILKTVQDIVAGIEPSEDLSKPTGRVSAVIPIFKPSATMLNRCLEVVLPQVDEVIVTREQAGIVPQGIIQHAKIKHVAAGESGIGFGKNVNFGARYATGDFLLLLNDDVYLAPDAVAKMLVEMRPGVGAVYPLLRYPNGSIYCGGKKFSGANGGHIDYHQMTPTIAVPTEMDDMNGAVMFVRRKAFEQVCGLDERIKFYLSDDYFSMSLRQAGWKIIYTPFATGIHDGHQETKIAPFNVAEEQKVSQVIFDDKWREVFNRNRGNGGLLKFE